MVRGGRHFARKEFTMKRLILSAVAVAALSSGAVWADAECQAGSAWGAKPGCGAQDQPPPATVWGWTPPGSVQEQQRQSQAYPYGYGYPQISQIFGIPQYQALPQLRAGEQIWVDPSTGTPYRVTPRNWDRDGDGVSNTRDRYPDDPRYR
jgi:hypothetical protein